MRPTSATSRPAASIGRGVDVRSSGRPRARRRARHRAALAHRARRSAARTRPGSTRRDRPATGTRTLTWRPRAGRASPGSCGARPSSSISSPVNPSALEVTDLGDHVVGDRLAEDRARSAAPRGSGWASESSSPRSFSTWSSSSRDTRVTGAAHRLVGREHQRRETGGAVQRRHREHRRDRGAVRHRDDARADPSSASGFTSGIDNGTSGSMRNALELSMHIVPFAAASGMNDSRDGGPGADERHIDPAQEVAVSSRTSIGLAAEAARWRPPTARRRAATARRRGSAARRGCGSSPGRRPRWLRRRRPS